MPKYVFLIKIENYSHIIKVCEDKGLLLDVCRISKSNNRNIYGKRSGPSHYSSVITLNVNGVDSPPSSRAGWQLDEWINNQDPSICCCQKHISL